VDSKKLQTSSPQTLAIWFRHRAGFAQERPVLTFEGNT
jgi:hypothetical protein